MKKLIIFQVFTGEWLAGTSTLNQVLGPSKDESVKLWKVKNPGVRVRVFEQKYVDGNWIEEVTQKCQKVTKNVSE